MAAVHDTAVTLKTFASRKSQQSRIFVSAAFQFVRNILIDVNDVLRTSLHAARTNMFIPFPK